MKKLFLVAMLLLLITANVSALNIITVETSPSTVEPGNRATIDMKIENNHGETIENIIVKLDFSSPELPLSPAGSSTETVDELEDDEDEKIDFDVLVLPDAKPGVYKIPVSISYELDGAIKEKQDVVSLIVDTQTKLDVMLEDPDFIIGDKATISIETVNKGLSDAQFLTVKLGSSSFYDILSSNEVYIGELDSDDSDDAKFDIKLNFPIPEELTVSVYLDYYDSLNNHKQEVQKVKIPVYTTKEAKELGLIQSDYTGYYVGAAILLIILFVVFRKIRKRRKR